MTKIDLVTGFLGSGKTTWIKKYASYLIRQGEKIAVLENDYGAVNVDLMLLQDLSGEQCELEMVAGACDHDCHKRRFKTKLIALGMQGFDRVIIEPSGIYDVDEFFDVLHEEPLDQWYEICNVMTVVDARLETDLSEHSEYLLASQLANAGTILLSKTSAATKEDVDRTLSYLNDILKKAKSNRTLGEECMGGAWESWTAEQYEKARHCGYHLSDMEKHPVMDENQYSTVYYMNLVMTEEMLRQAIWDTFADPACGEVFRIKGFMQREEGWMEVNATRQTTHIRPVEKGQNVVIIIGENLRQESIDKYWQDETNGKTHRGRCRV